MNKGERVAYIPGNPKLKGQDKDVKRGNKKIKKQQGGEKPT